MIFAIAAVLIFSITACGAKNEAPEGEAAVKQEAGNIPEPEEEGPPLPTEETVEYPIKDEVIIERVYKDDRFRPWNQRIRRLGGQALM